MTYRDVDVGIASARVARLSVSGEFGFEVYVPADYLVPLHERIQAAGRAVGLCNMSTYALNSLRLEKSFGYWARDFLRDYAPTMCGLSRFMAYEMPAFVGHDGALCDRDSPPPHVLVTLEVDAGDAEASYYEPIWDGATLAGFVTSGCQRRAHARVKGESIQ
jgi:dimethylglycine dehydrogenase